MSIENIWVVFELAGGAYGLGVKSIHELLPLTEVTRTPLAPAHVRGLMNVRGRALPVFDLRTLLGLGSLKKETDDFIAVFLQRKQDHVNWLAELEASIREARPFKLTTDPHKCAFGRWYDAYQAEDAVLRLELKKFDAPHQAIHALGDTAAALVAQGRQPDALKLVTDARFTVLESMLTLFDQTVGLIRAAVREIVMVTRDERGEVGFLVDSVTALRTWTPAEIEPFQANVHATAAAEFFAGVAHLDGRMVLLLNAERLLHGA